MIIIIAKKKILSRTSHPAFYFAKNGLVMRFFDALVFGQYSNHIKNVGLNKSFSAINVVNKTC